MMIATLGSQEFSAPQASRRFAAPRAQRRSSCPSIVPERRVSSSPVALLAQVPFFASLEEQELQSLADQCQVRRYKAGQALFYEGDPGHALYLIRAGRVKILRLAPDGQEMILHLSGPGEWLGEMALLDDASRSATVEALEPVEALLLPREAFLAVLERRPAVARAVMAELARMVRQMSEQLHELVRLDVQGRIAWALLGLAERHGEARLDGVWVPLPLTREELAQIVGAARTTVTTELNQLQERGVLTVEREGITLHRLEPLRQRVA